jgi:hypothetical protein
MCSEERGAIYSETLVLWEELQVHIGLAEHKQFCGVSTCYVAFFLPLLLFVACIQNPLNYFCCLCAGVKVPGNDRLLQCSNCRMAQGWRDSTRSRRASLHEIKQNFANGFDL